MSPRLAVACCAFALGPWLAGCSTSGSPVFVAVSTAPTVTFELIDGPPEPVFRKLVAEAHGGCQCAQDRHRIARNAGAISHTGLRSRAYPRQAHDPRLGVGHLQRRPAAGDADFRRGPGHLACVGGRRRSGDRAHGTGRHGPACLVSRGAIPSPRPRGPGRTAAARRCAWVSCRICSGTGYGVLPRASTTTLISPAGLPSPATSTPRRQRMIPKGCRPFGQRSRATSRRTERVGIKTERIPR